MSNIGDIEAISAETYYVSSLSDLSIWSDASPQLKEYSIYDQDASIIRNWVSEGNIAFTEDNVVHYFEVVPARRFIFSLFIYWFLF